MGQTPLIDVILPTYQGATRGYLKDAIESVLNQTYTHFQLIIIDDGSTDNTSAICQEYHTHPKVSLYKKDNGGLASARNQGVEKSTAPFLCFLDDDDLFEPEKLEKQATFVSQDQPFGLLYSAVTHIDHSNTPIQIWHHPAHKNLYQQLFFGNCISAPSTTLIPRKVFQTIGPFDENLSCCEDYDMWLRIGRQYPIYSLDEPLVRYRIHPGNMSKDLERMQCSKLSVIEKALQTAPEGILHQRNQIYYQHYKSCCDQYLGLNLYARYRESHVNAAHFGYHSLKDMGKYYCSFFPPIFQALKWIRGGFG